MSGDPRYVRLRHEAAHWMILAAAIVFSLPMLFVLLDGIWLSEDRWIVDIVKTHYSATIGAPMMAIAALVIVSAFKMISGEIEFSMFGIVFKGASGPVILWVFVFLSMVMAVHLLWNDKFVTISP